MAAPAPAHIAADGEERADHPDLALLLKSLQKYDTIKYAAYRAAFKIYDLQKQLQVPPIRLTAGVFNRHCLSMSESSLTLEVCELEAVLNDIYFAAAKEHQFNGDADKTADLLLNILINIFDSARNMPIRVQSAKILLILLSSEPCEDKWSALVETCADHNGCVSSRRLASLLGQVGNVAEFVGEGEAFGRQHAQGDADRCFAKSSGMLGMSTRAVVSWALMSASGGSVHTRWLTALQRVCASRNSPSNVAAVCSACKGSLVQVLIFTCAKCGNSVICEKCYLYDDMVLIAGHKKTHLVQELIEDEPQSPKCLGFIRPFRKFFCPKFKKSKRRKARPADNEATIDRPAGFKEAKVKVNSNKVFTSTVGKASGVAGSPDALLQDIIAQLETQNRALKDLSSHLESDANSVDNKLRHKVDSHWGQIATQINRLKILKENLTANIVKPTKDNRLQAFDLFSPIPMLQEETEPKSLKGQPRVLSLDSGNFSDASKPSHEALMTMSGDNLKPVVVHATSDSISTVSMNDISTWFGNDADSTNAKLRQSAAHRKVDRSEPRVDQSKRSNSLCVTEDRYNADLRTVATSNDKMRELNADLDTVLDRLQQILSNNFVLDDSCFDNTQLRETANEMEGLLGTLIRGVEQRTTMGKSKVSAV